MYIMYLRKSRADIEAEQQGEMETLARHEATLTEYAQKNGITIDKTYKEIVSGDSIYERPMMQQLLQDVGKGNVDGVLVMEIERLARGNTIDQGIVAQTFKSSNTLIITPHKTYNPSNEFDETFLEFNLFMSRQEYKTIKRRLMAGRISSVKEGNYLGAKDPYGYTRIHNRKDLTLAVVPEEAEVIRKIFSMYVNESKGFTAIANELNNQGLDFTFRKVDAIIHNPLYKGYVSFGKRKEITVVDEDGRRHKEYHRQKEFLCCKGKHEAIVSEEIWNQANEIAEKRAHSSKQQALLMRNKLTSLLFCTCGRAMRLKLVKRPYNDYHYYQCHNCGMKQTPESDVLNKVNEMISEHYSKLKSEYVTSDSNLAEITEQGKRISSAKTELKKLDAQKSKIYDAFEKEIYDVDTFNARMSIIKNRESELQKIINEPRIQYIDYQASLINFETFVEKIPYIEDNTMANEMYKLIINRIEYSKPTTESEMELSIQFKI